MKINQSIAVPLGILHILMMFTSCMKTVTKHKIETKPVVVTRYRTVTKPVKKEVEVPYREEIKTPEYKQISESKINPSNRTMKIAFLPFTCSTGNKNDGFEISNRIRNKVIRHPDFGNKYKLIRSPPLEEVVNKNNLLELSPEDIKVLNKSLGLETLISGHVRNKLENNISFKMEAIDARRMNIRLSRIFNGDFNKSIEEIINIFFGKKILSGHKIEYVTKYKIEYKTVYEEIEEPYKTTIYKEVKVPYEEKEIDWAMTVLAVILLYAYYSSQEETKNK